MSDDARAGRGDGLGVRVAVLVGIVLLVGVAVAYVVRTDIDRRTEDPSAAAATVTTYVPPPPPGTGTVPTAGSTVPLPDPGPLTGSAVAIELEKAVRTSTGWTHKVWCTPAADVGPGDVLSCTAETEPPIDEVAPSLIIAVVVEGDRVVWARGREGPYSLDVLLGNPDQTCGSLLGAGYPYAATLAWWSAFGRPDALVEGDVADRPCLETYGETEVDAAFAAAVGPGAPG